MSSFVINKTEYIKAAGLMYGIHDASHRKSEHFLNHVRYWFKNCYSLNVKSCNWQYDEPVEEDTDEYSEIFEAYKDKGRKIAIGMGEGDVQNINDLRIRLMKFFACVLYQIEDEDCNEYAAWLAFICMEQLYAAEVEQINGWWGEIEI